MVTRREQLGTDAHSLPKKTPAKTKKDPSTPSTARGRGKGGGRGGRGKKQQDKKDQDKKEDEVVEHEQAVEVPPNPDEKPKRKRASTSTMKRPAASKSAASTPTAPKVDDIPVGADTEGSASKKPKTWAGRWIPQEDGAPLRKMMAIKQVWAEFIQSKLSGGQSILASTLV